MDDKTGAWTLAELFGLNPPRLPRVNVEFPATLSFKQAGAAVSLSCTQYSKSLKTPPSVSVFYFDLLLLFEKLVGTPNIFE